MTEKAPPERVWFKPRVDRDGQVFGITSETKFATDCTEYLSRPHHDALIAEARAEERERVAQALDDEAASTPCEEDAMVTRSCAKLVRADFSYAKAFDGEDG